MAKKRNAEAIWIESQSRWLIKVQKDGVRRSFTSSIKGRKGKHAAENKADEWLEKGTTDMRFNAAWELFLDYKREHTGTANSRQIELYGRRYLLPTVGPMRLSSITPVVWQKCIDIPYKNGLSRRTCTNVRATIHSFVKYCRLNRWEIESLEDGDLIVKKDAPVGVRQILQPQDIATLFSEDTYFGRNHVVTHAHYIHAWRFMAITGLRRGELCGLRHEDINGDIVHIQRSINEQREETRGKNENANRWFVLPELAKSVMADQAQMLKKLGIVSPWVFPDEYGERTDPKHIYELWRTYKGQHSIKSSLHELRHTFISAVKNELPLPQLKAIVGHSETMDTIGVYGHEMEGELSETARIIDSVFAKILKTGTNAGTSK